MLTPHFLSNLLTYKEMAPAVLRLAAACVFLFLAYWHYKNKKEAAQEISVLSHEVAVWAIGVYVLVEFLIAAALLVGFWTQLAAIVGLIVCLKVLLLKRSLRALAPLSRSTYLLLGAICISLIFTGAGILFAIDLPL